MVIQQLLVNYTFIDILLNNYILLVLIGMCSYVFFFLEMFKLSGLIAFRNIVISRVPNLWKKKIFTYVCFE